MKEMAREMRGSDEAHNSDVGARTPDSPSGTRGHLRFRSNILGLMAKQPPPPDDARKIRNLAKLVDELRHGHDVVGPDDVLAPHDVLAALRKKAAAA